jgi:transcriptional regulator with XRE-family HTH domain
MAMVGQYLRAIREARQLSMGDVEKRTAITTTRLNRIEHDNIKEPSPTALKQLAELYEIDLVSLFVKAGYLDANSVSAFSRVFSGVEKLNEDEKKHIQQQIDFLNKRQESLSK